MDKDKEVPETDMKEQDNFERWMIILISVIIMYLIICIGIIVTIKY